MRKPNLAGLFVIIFVFIISCIIPFTFAGAAEKNILFIFDASGSMKTSLQGKSKLTIAKEVMSALVSDLPVDANVGLLVYGNKERAECDSIEIMVPLKKLDVAALQKAISSMAAFGKTPIAASLEKSAALLRTAAGEKALILVSDGEETCGGDPIIMAGKIKQEFGMDVVIHTVGFGVDKKTKEQLMGIAQAGEGAYYSADSADELKKSLVTIKEQVVEKAPESPKPEAPKEEKPQVVEIFSENFNGKSLREGWEVLRENNDSKVLEKGALTIISGSGKLNDETLNNVYLCKQELPEKCEITLKYKTEIKDFNSSWGKSQWAGLVLYGDKDNYLYLVSAGRDYAGNPYLAIEFNKHSGGEALPGHALERPQVSTPDSPWTFNLKIVKDGYKYTAYYGFEGASGFEWKEVGTHPMLGKKLYAGLVSFHGNRMKEAISEFDDFKINEIK